MDWASIKPVAGLRVESSSEATEMVFPPISVPRPKKKTRSKTRVDAVIHKTRLGIPKARKPKTLNPLFL